MSLQEIADELREATNASRITIRIDPEKEYPVVAEALAPGVKSIKGSTVPRDSTAPTFLFLKKERRILLQDDCLTSPPVYPEIVERYGVRSQMLSPLVREGDVVGIISVHYADPKHWSEEEVAALEKATERVHRELDAESGR